MDKKKIWSAPLALIAVVTMALFFGGVTVSADELESGSCGENVAWSLDSNGTLTISGSGAMQDFDFDAPWYLGWRYSIEKVVIEEGITKIGKSAFSSLNNVTTVSIPSTVTEIGTYAFDNCTSLTAVSIPSGVKAIKNSTFNYCKGLTTLSIPASVETIGEYSIANCDNLETVTFAANSALKTIEKSAFNYDYNLSSINLPDSITGIGPYAFKSCESLTTINLGNSLKTIEDYAFSECTNLSSVSFPASVKTIGECAFEATAISSLSLPSGIEKIDVCAFDSCRKLTSLNLTFDNDVEFGGSVFANCTGLTSVTLSGNITTIGAAMFYGCENLSTLSIPDGITTIGSSAFTGCSSMTSFTFPASLTKIGDQAFASTGLTSVSIPKKITFGESVYSYCNSLSTVTIEDGVPVIPAGTFQGCWYNLKTISIPSSVTSIEREAFYGSGLTSVEIPSSVIAIGPNAFYTCSNLESVTLNEGLVSIGGNAFEGCSNLKSISVPNSVMSIGSRAFACTGIKSINVTLHTPVYGLVSGCFNLETATIKGNITTLESGFFSDCSKLTSVTLPDTLTVIESSTFSECRSLANIEIPANVESIGLWAFYNCTSLTSVTIPAKVTEISDQAFEKSGLTSIVIPDTVTTFGQAVFSNCKSLKTVTLPSNMPIIPVGMFAGCSSLSSIDIPSSVDTICDNAFNGCGFTSLSIPGTAKYIGTGSFGNCSKLRTVVIHEGVLLVYGSAFSGSNSLETAVFPSTISPDNISYPFNECNSLKTIFCTEAQKSMLLYDKPNANYIIITDADHIPGYVAGHSISLAADICVNFYLALPMDYDENNTTVEFTWGEGIDFNTQKSYVHNVSAKLTPVNEHGSNYKVTCGVASRAMGDTITMVVKSGNEEILRDTYSVIEYVNILAKANRNDTKLQNLLTAMVAYGSYSQMYFNYKSDNDLVRNKYDNTYDTWQSSAEFYTNTVSMDIPAENLTIKNIANDNLGLKYYGASIMCASQTKMRFYFEVTDTDAFNAISGTASYKGVSLKFVNTKVNGQDLVYIETQGLMPGDLESVFNISIGSNVYTYDFRDYIIRVDDVDTFFTSTAKGAYAYSHFAKIYQEG